MNKFFVNKAKEFAKHSTHRFRVGAVVYKNKRYWCAGYNQATKTHPKSTHPYNSIHAELDAILGEVAGSDYWYPGMLNGWSIYIHRLKKDGSDGLAKPCKHCEKLLKMVGIKDIRYSK